MNLKSQVIDEIQKQREVLAELISQLQAKEVLDFTDCQRYETATKRVEAQLRNIRANFLEGLS